MPHQDKTTCPCPPEGFSLPAVSPRARPAGVSPSTVETDGFAITAITKLAHAELLRVTEEHGGATAFAKELGISPGTLSSWIYLRAMPGCGAIDAIGRRKTPKTYAAVKKLCELTGRLPEELFPGYIRQRLTGKNFVRRTTRLMKQHQLTGTIERRLVYDHDFAEPSPTPNLRDSVLQALEELPARELDVIKFRYGFLGGRPLTLAEIARLFDVTIQCISQIEQRALRRLRASRNHGDLTRLWEAIQ